MLDFDAHLSVADSAITEHLGTAGSSYKGIEGEVIDLHIILEQDVQVVKEDGYTTLRQTHASFAKLPFAMCADDLITCKGEAYRLVEPLFDDGFMVTVSLVRRG